MTPPPDQSIGGAVRRASTTARIVGYELVDGEFRSSPGRIAALADTPRDQIVISLIGANGVEAEALLSVSEARRVRTKLTRPIRELEL